MSLLQRLKRSVRAGLYSVNAESLLYNKSPKGDLVLLFHNVLEKTDTKTNLRNIGQQEFRTIMRSVMNMSDVVTLDQICTKKSDKPRVAVTFDDGLVNNLTYALPVIEELKFPATIFVSTTRVIGEGMIWPDELSLLLSRHKKDVIFRDVVYHPGFRNQYRSAVDNVRLESEMMRAGLEEIRSFLEQLILLVGARRWEEEIDNSPFRVLKGEEIRVMAQSPFITIGSHGVTHLDMSLMHEEQLISEFNESKNYLEHALSDTVEWFAFPFGRYSESAIRLAKASGYKYLAGVVSETGNAIPPDIRQRYGVYNDISTVESIHQIRSFFQ